MKNLIETRLGILAKMKRCESDKQLTAACEQLADFDELWPQVGRLMILEECIERASKQIDDLKAEIAGLES